jgi:hypothetical protein
MVWPQIPEEMAMLLCRDVVYGAHQCVLGLTVFGHGAPPLSVGGPAGMSVVPFPLPALPTELG